MPYQEFKPSKKLAHVVDSFWFFSSLERVKNEKILPDGCMDIIFNFGSLTGSIAPNEIGVTGMMTEYSNKSFEKNTALLGVRFKPGMLGEISSFPLFEIKNSITEASVIVPEFNLEAMERLIELKSIAHKLKLIEDVIFKIINSKSAVNNSLVFSVINVINNSSVSLSIEEIAKHHFISLRQLERKFKYHVGVTAKEYERIARFKKTKEIIKSHTKDSLLDIALSSGYSDHSHLANEFKRFSGQTPSEFR